ncbi:hypothetical protein CPB84DRAFT_1755008 [Gymnopilus junonius]|uniref:Uncharacterized protein n=1 Tax=Gymnopilus junonius TaxID=109634 RepID=A0A9P5TF56_GYMJU|nr:hypothetical protein CPB84DRAFT_1755008 [Gymnopilus junonius]
MPPHSLFASLPDDKYPSSYEIQEAEAKLKLHVHMTRIRTALHVIMTANLGYKLYNWRLNMQDEVELLDSTNEYCYWWLEKYADTPMLPQDTECLPEEYCGCIPRHDAHDGILKAITRNARNYIQWDGKMKPRPKRRIYNIRYVHPDQVNSGTPPPDSGSKDSGSGPTSVPDDFHPGSSDESSGSDQSARSLFEDKNMEDEEDGDGEEYGDDNLDQDDNEGIDELAVV